MLKKLQLNLITFLNKIPVRIRLSLGHAIWMAILLIGIGFGLYRTIETQILDSIDAAILSSAKSVRDAEFSQSVSRSRPDMIFKHFFQGKMTLDQLLGASYIEPYAQLIDVSGKVHSSTGNARVHHLPVMPQAVARAEKGLATFETFTSKNQPTLRLVTLPVMARGKFTGELIQVGAPLSETYENLDQIFLIIWIALALGLMVSIMLGYLLSGSAFKPVKNISSAASRIAIDDLSIRLPLPDAKDELREISITFNAMLDRLEESVHRLRRFTGDVSHELRTPLAVMRGEAELALRRLRTPESYQETLKSISTEAIHMTGVIEDLLLLARAESKNVALSPMPIPLDDFVKELIQVSHSIYLEKNIKLQSDYPPDLQFIATRGYLTLAIKNILINAAKHSPKDGVVEFSVYLKQGNINFEIKDYGEGIPEKSIPLIFDSFYRADTARNRAAGGVGIGLSLALALVKLHLGSIEVKSKIDEGSTFTVSMPYLK